jgi:hypothetical protein
MLTILLTWWVGRRWLGPAGALAAAAFYAGGFWSSFLGRSGWQPVFLQLSVILCLDALLILGVRRWPWALVLASGWLALMVQLHYIAVVFVALVPLAAIRASRALRPLHAVLAIVVATAVLAPFLMYELNPSVRFRDLGLLSGQVGGDAHFDLEAWWLMWTVAGNGGAAGLGGPEAEALREALGRWSNLGWIGVPLVGLGLIALVAGWPRGWQGWLLALWALMPAIGLARHTVGVIFHYLYLALPGMALAVGALAEWSAFGHRRWARAALGGALTAYAGVSIAMLWVVLAHVDRTGEYPALSRPLGLNMAAANAARAALPPGGQVLIGGHPWEAEVLRFSLGYGVRSRVFDDCGLVPQGDAAIYLLTSERSPAAGSLAAEGASVISRVPRPGDAFLLLGPPTVPVAAGDTNSAACRERLG